MGNLLYHLYKSYGTQPEMENGIQPSSSSAPHIGRDADLPIMVNQGKAFKGKLAHPEHNIGVEEPTKQWLQRVSIAPRQLETSWSKQNHQSSTESQERSNSSRWLYHQIRGREEDRIFLRYIRFPEDDYQQIHQMVSVLFGAIANLFILNSGLCKLVITDFLIAWRHIQSDRDRFVNICNRFSNANSVGRMSHYTHRKNTLAEWSRFELE